MSEALKELAKCHRHPKVTLEDEECNRCDGEGVVEDDDDLLTERPPHVSCWGCGGKGFLRAITCFACNDEIEEEMYQLEAK